MGCNQSSENQWAYSSENAPMQRVSNEIRKKNTNLKLHDQSFCLKDKPMAIVAPVPMQQVTVS